MSSMKSSAELVGAQRDRRSRDRRGEVTRRSGLLGRHAGSCHLAWSGQFLPEDDPGAVRIGGDLDRVDQVPEQVPEVDAMAPSEAVGAVVEARASYRADHYLEREPASLAQEDSDRPGHRRKRPEDRLDGELEIVDGLEPESEPRGEPSALQAGDVLLEAFDRQRERHEVRLIRPQWWLLGRRAR